MAEEQQTFVSYLGPRWIGRRGDGESPKGAGVEEGSATQPPPAPVPGTSLCRPRELMPESCSGGHNNSILSNDQTIRYETMNDMHVEEVLQLLVHSFFREEPLGLAAGIRTPEDVRMWLPDFVRPMAKEGVSVVAVEAESGRVVGVALNHVLSHTTEGHDSPLMAALDPARDGKMMAVAQFLADLHIGLQDEVDGKPGGVLSLLLLNVERHFSGRGIAAELVRRSEDRARSKGLKNITADTTGEFSCKALSRLGFDVIRELRYEDYQGSLQPGPIHSTARVMIKELQ